MNLTPRILNLGAGVQSTTVALLELDGKLPACDHWIFADVQEEPEAVYKHLEWLKVLADGRLLTGTAGKLGDHLLHGINSTGQSTGRFATIPTFTKHPITGKVGRNKRQCTKEYKVDPVERVIRREVFGMAPGSMFPKGTLVTQVFGISWDERERADRIRKRLNEQYWSAEPQFPLLDLRWTRDDCKSYLEAKGIDCPRSACVFCPYKSATEWLLLKTTDPTGWARAVEIDRALRSGVVLNRTLDQPMYLVKQCVPLEEVDLEAEAAKEEARDARRESLPLFSLMLAAEDCEDACYDGMCGV